MCIRDSSEGFQTDPLYLPVSGASFFLCIIFAVMIGEGIAFKFLEINHESSYSSKYLLSKRASQRSIFYIVLSVIIIIILLTPPIVGLFENFSSEDGSLASGETHTFSSETITGTMYLTGLTLFVDSGEADVFVIYEKDFDNVGMNFDNLRIRTLGNFYHIEPGNKLEISFEPSEMQNFMVIVYSANSNVNYDIHYSMSSTFRFVLPLLMVIVAGVNLAWYIALIPMKKKFKSLSVYA